MANVTGGIACRASTSKTLWRLKRDVGTFATPLRRYQSSLSTGSFSPSTQSHNQVPLRLFSTTRRTYSSPKFTYGISASYCAKESRYSPTKNLTPFNPYNPIPTPIKPADRRPASGQDAFFVAPVSKTSDIALGIADGVGGWIDSGVDPSDFSHGFCEYMAHTASTSNTVDEAPISARRLMQKGYDLICASGKVHAGGSTAVVGVFNSGGNMEVANLGDSGYIQLRSGAVHSASEFQTHAFNTPYQLSLVPEAVMRQAAKFGGQQLMDLPRDAEVISKELKHGDVVVFASDGVWDNLSGGDVLRIVSKRMRYEGAWVNGVGDGGTAVGEKLGESIEEGGAEGEDKGTLSLQSSLAVDITGEAKTASLSLRRDGPFAREVQRRYPDEKWSGGKADDICVVVVVVVEEGK
ncbi:Protein phosphatase 2C 7 [Ciborinia camelliae]|nr:Protein phosphatase 2C 7 [Ciborinia camelliae]